MTKPTIGLYIVIILLTITTPLMHISYYFKSSSHTGPPESLHLTFGFVGVGNLIIYTRVFCQQLS